MKITITIKIIICYICMLLLFFEGLNIYPAKAEYTEDKELSEVFTTESIVITTKEETNSFETSTEESSTEVTTTEKCETEEITPEVTTTEILTEETTVDETTTKIPNTVCNTFTVKFDYNGGLKSTSKIIVKRGSKYGKLPKAQRRYYQFEGWYTQKNAGRKITNNTIVNLTAEQTLYARWSKISVSSKIKVKSIRQKTGKISLKVSKAKYASGYVIYCSYDKKFKKTKKMNVTGKKRKKKYTFVVKKVLKKAKPGWTYYYRVRPYIIDSVGKKVWGKYGKVYSILYRKK